MRTSDGAADAAGFCGLDTTYYISQIMYEEFKERRFAGAAVAQADGAGGRMGESGAWVL